MAHINDSRHSAWVQFIDQLGQPDTVAKKQMPIESQNSDAVVLLGQDLALLKSSDAARARSVQVIPLCGEAARYPSQDHQARQAYAHETGPDHVAEKFHDGNDYRCPEPEVRGSWTPQTSGADNLDQSMKKFTLAHEKALQQQDPRHQAA